MKANNTETTMNPEQFTAALAALGWKQSDFCRKSGVTKQTPSRWANSLTPIPAWVPAYLGLLLELQRLHAAYLVPPTAETMHLLSSPANASHLAESIAQYRVGKAKRRELVDE